MKLPYAQLESHLNKQLAPIYLVSGDELLLTQEAADLIRTTARKNGFSERARINVETGSDWAKLLYENAHALSLFSTQRILELDLRGVKLNTATSEALQNYAEQPPPNTLLIVHTYKLDAKSEQSRWFKALENKGAAIQIWPINNEQLPQWIMQRAKKMQLNLSTRAAAWLAEQVEGNLLAAAQEIEKLSLLQITETLDENQLATIIANHAHFDVFNLVDSVLANKKKRALQILAALRGEDTEPTLILWALTRELRTMAEIRKQQTRGVDLGTLFNQFRIWDKRQPAVRTFLKEHTQEQCWELLLRAAKIDRCIKGMEPGNSWNELEKLLL